MKNYLPEGRLINTRANMLSLRSYAALTEACKNRTVLEAKVAVCDASHNLIVDLGCMKGIIPREEGAMGLLNGEVRDIALISKVNKPVCFIITGFIDKEDETTALLSRRIVQEQCKKEYVDNLKPGDVVETRITHFEPFGAFTDIGCGIASLITIDSISISRIAHPSDRFRIGQDVKAVVKAVEDGRISLTHKELLGTWEENAKNFSVGETVSGIIRSVESYGIFIELAPNFAGLAEPKAGVKVGQRASVYIKSLIPEKMKVKLVIIDTFEGDYAPFKIKYFFNEPHMQKFIYSPANCSKIIETVFE